MAARAVAIVVVLGGGLGPHQRLGGEAAGCPRGHVRKAICGGVQVGEAAAGDEDLGGVEAGGLAAVDVPARADAEGDGEQDHP
ncbi:hypothetical protein OV079_31760 [Nannocystis pusilla]|uniref:Uncharacterized protein n=1 Tax=Nannocystis pusilla TaxID=889268 RepID=A0A9X3IYZ5_9BACT|nr:hypothetical protein [Nannocystis pusilla]MCY1010062.1 hypothetical protein [Nannocystis pusilla]